jgi:phage shock protein PspC (stress-responsive transcriptional regulator)
MDLFDELRSRHATDIFHKNRLFEVVVKIFTIHEIRYYFERHGFDVFSRLSDRLGIAVKNIRLFFVYFTFVTLGVSFGLYLILAFLLKLKDMVYTKRTSVFDL